MESHAQIARDCNVFQHYNFGKKTKTHTDNVVDTHIKQTEAVCLDTFLIFLTEEFLQQWDPVGSFLIPTIRK